MATFKFTSVACAVLLLAMVSGAKAGGSGTTLYVKCGGSTGLTSIGAALKALQYSEGHGTGTINVYGACHENLVIQNTQQLMLNGVNGASISDASNGQGEVIAVSNARVTISGFTVNGGTTGIDCSYGSYCQLFGNTVQGASGNAVFIFQASGAYISGGVLQNSGGGLYVRAGDVLSVNLTVQQNSGVGVSVDRGGRLTFKQSVSSNNQGYGIWMQGGNFGCNACTVTGDLDVGVYVGIGSTADVAGAAGPVMINSSGGGLGVYVDDGSTAYFHGAVNVTGSGGSPAITCNSASSVTRGAIAAAGGAANTNCTN